MTGDWIFANTAGTAVTVLVPQVLVGRRRVPEAVAARAACGGERRLIFALPAGGGVE